MSREIEGTPGGPSGSGPALLLVDVQRGLDDPVWGARNNPDAEARMAALLAVWRQAGRTVLHVQHMSTESDSPLRPDTPGNAIKDEVAPTPGEPLFQKSVNSAFIGTELEAYLRMHGLRTLVVAGLTTDHCVSTTARMAANLGFEVLVVDDATATFERVGPDGATYAAEQMHRTALASLHGEFAEVCSTAEILQRFGRSEPPKPRE